MPLGLVKAAFFQVSWNQEASAANKKSREEGEEGKQEVIMSLADAKKWMPQYQQGGFFLERNNILPRERGTVCFALLFSKSLFLFCLEDTNSSNCNLF